MSRLRTDLAELLLQYWRLSDSVEGIENAIHQPRHSLMTDSAEHEYRHSDDLTVTDRIRIPAGELTLSFMRSSGPGGQNVNKVNSKVRLRWSVAASISLPDDVKQRFLTRYHRRITSTGDLLITSQRYRDQAKNVIDCREKLRELIVAVVPPPKPRRKTRPTRASRERRLNEKRKRTSRKQSRRPPAVDD